MVVNHNMFEGWPCQGSLTFLYWYAVITVHVMALMIRLETSRQCPGWPDNGVGHPKGHPHYG